MGFLRERGISLTQLRVRGNAAGDWAIFSQESYLRLEIDGIFAEESHQKSRIV
jgi:hypothetical protein